MRKTARAIVVKDGQLLVMKRNKFGTEFYALLGGGIDMGETPEQALHRELLEEASVELANPALVIIEDAGPMYGVQYLFTADYVSGEPQLHDDSEEAKVHALGQNLYEPMWVPIKELNDANFRPKDLLPTLMDGLTRGWPEEPISLTVRE